MDSFFDSLGIVPFFQILSELPFYSILRPFYFMLFLPRNIANKRRASQLFAEETLKKRMSLGTDRPDFVDVMLRSEGEMVRGTSDPASLPL